MAKKKIKKLLKGLGMGAALLGAGKALMNRRNRNAMLNSADANDGFRSAFTRPNMLDIAGVGIPDRGRGNIMPRVNPMLTSDDYNSPMFTEAAAKKGGMIVKTEKGGKAVRRKKKVGIQIKGFGKARKR